MTVDHVAPVSPLAAWRARFAARTDDVAIAELPLVGQLTLRLDPDGRAAAAVARVLGTALPAQPGTSARAGELELLWMGPDEWLVIAPRAPFDLLDALRDAIGDEPGAVVDVSAQRTRIALTGARARDVLAKGCSIDLHPGTSPAGSCVQTLLAQTGVTIVVRDNRATDFVLLVRASFADYLAAWLLDASAEY